MTPTVDAPQGCVTAAQYARLRGVSKQAVSKWPLVKVPDPARPGRELVDVAASDARRGVEQNPLKRFAPIASAQVAPEPSPDRPAAPLSPDFAQAQGRASRVEREHWAAQNERLSYGERVGALVSRHAAEKAQDDVLRTIRMRLMTVGARVSQRVAEETDHRAIRAMIDDEIRRVLTASADEFEAEADLAEATGDEAADA